MIIKLQLSHVMLGLDGSEARLPVDGSQRTLGREMKRGSCRRRSPASILPGLAVAVIDDHASCLEAIEQRATKQTHVLEEILSHPYGCSCQKQAPKVKT